MKIKKPLPRWAIQLIHFAYAFLFTGAGYAYVELKNQSLASAMTVLAPCVHGLLVVFVGEEPKGKE